MKNDNLTKNSISESLLNKNTYYVLLTSHEDSSNLRGDIAMLRKEFFENKEKTVKVSKASTKNGLDGNVQGKLSRHNFIWKKVEGGISTEECYKNNGIYVVTMRDLNGNLRSKISYNKNMLWIKTEYFSINDFVNAELIFKPVNTENAIERFTYDSAKKNYTSTLLYPIAYSPLSEERSIMDASFTEAKLLVSTESGEFIYCSKEEIENRDKKQAEINESTNILNSVWTDSEIVIPDEIKELVSSIPAPVASEITEINETEASPIEEKAEKSENTETAEIAETNTETSEKTEEIENTPEDTTEETIPEPEKPEAIQAKIELDESFGAESSEKYGEKLVYTGTLIEGKRNGRGRTDRKSGLTAFDGEYSDNKRDGFGCSYYKNGNLSYAGFWKDDKKDGMGVSFRNSDHAVQITNWKEGKPESHTSIFDNEGYLKYTGNIKDGVKNGLCITYNKEEGGLFAGKWLQNGESGCGALFDNEGNLIYAGFLKDGKREGQGTEFDKNGEVVFTGIFENDEYKTGTLYKKI